MRPASLSATRSAMKALLVLMLLAFLGSEPLEICGQESGGWINISPSDEQFQVRLPQQPKIETTKTSYGSLSAEGRIYTASHSGATYTVWSLKTADDHPGGMGPGVTTSREYFAAFVWESLLKPVRDAVPESSRAAARMSFKSDLYLGVIQGREYSLSLGDKSGTARVYVDGQRLYVLVALNARRSSSATRRFLAGFKAQPTSLPVAAVRVADPLLVPPDTRRLPYSRPQFALPPSRSNRIYSVTETTRKARVTSKPEPQYPQAAKDNNVWGTVIIRVVLTKDGRVENIKVVQGLPHGLTQAAIAAARKLTFIPATKDGYSVSQSALFEYSFNPY